MSVLNMFRSPLASNSPLFPALRPDNSLARQRQALHTRASQRVLTGMGSLGDNPQLLPNRVLATRDDQPYAAIDTPVIPGPQPTDLSSLLQQIRDILLHMPQMLASEFKRDFILTPRGALAFQTPGGPLTVQVNQAVAVCSVSIAESFTGFLTHVGVAVLTPGQFQNVSWQIRINGFSHPNFNNNIFAATDLSTPIPFPVELTQNMTLQLVAINNGTPLLPGPIDVSGILVGWSEYMTSNLAYGSSPVVPFA